MLTIYIQQRPLHLLPKPLAQLTDESTHLQAVYTGNVTQLQHYADILADPACPYTAISVIGDPETMLAEFAECYYLQAAAGGVVRNLEGNILMIFRRGFWDLPKGKIDKDEMSEQAALREVGEEVGLLNCEIVRPITITYHTFIDRKGRNILKPTYWYLMETPDDVVTLQTEEDIEASVWTAPNAFMQGEEPIYPNIIRVLQLL